MKKRPIHLNLFLIRFPVTAVASILHRIAGVILFLLIPMGLYAVEHVLLDLPLPCPRILCLGLIWLSLSALVYHLLAGIRHLVMDCGFFESLASARVTAKLVLLSSVLYSLWLGVRLWS